MQVPGVLNAGRSQEVKVAVCSPDHLATGHTCLALMFVPVLRMQYPFPPRAPQTAAVQLGFLPLNHLMGRMTLLKCLITGGQVSRWHFPCIAHITDFQTYVNSSCMTRLDRYVGNPENTKAQMKHTPAGYCSAFWKPLS